MSVNVIDMDTLNELKEIMEDDFDDLINTFIADGQDQLDNLQSAIADSVTADIRRIAHTLKGSSANLGAHALSESCKVLEHNAAEENLTEADMQFSTIKSEYELVKSALHENF